MMLHKGLTHERWFKLSLFEQLANVGMEIERAIKWEKKPGQKYNISAFERAVELLNLTIQDPKNWGARCRELLRARELLIDHFVCDNEYKTTPESWQDYFYPFAYAAAIQRGR